MATRNNGDLRVCCQANMSDNQGMLKNEKGMIYNAGRNNINEAFNAPILKEIRLNMLNGEWSSECERCKIEEESGLPTRRLNEIDQWKDRFTFDDAVKATAGDGSVELKPIYFDLRFGNFCNLKCRMCGPTDSHSLYDDFMDYWKEGGFTDTHGFVRLVKNEKGRWFTKDYNWYEDEHFWSQLEENIHNVEHVYMVGGEPLLIERHELFLKKCIELNCSKNILLEYNTNLSVLPDRILDLWKNFKRVRVGASIDGMADVLEYQRYPLKWDHVLKNLRILDSYAVKNDNIVPSIGLTVTAYNAFHIPEFMWWKVFESGFQKINGQERRPILSHHMCHNPERANPQLYPSHIKDQLKIHYDLWIKKFDESDAEEYVKEAARDILTSIINYVYLEDLSHYIEEFVGWTKYLDNTRSQSIKAVVPELGELFD